MVMAGLVLATPLIKAPSCHMIGVAGPSPAMTVGVGGAVRKHEQRPAKAPFVRARVLL
jgi:hypothetical protein